MMVFFFFFFYHLSSSSSSDTAAEVDPHSVVSVIKHNGARERGTLFILIHYSGTLAHKTRAVPNVSRRWMVIINYSVMGIRLSAVICRLEEPTSTR